MRLPEDQIKQALLHDDPIVRQIALQYFTLSFSRDRSVMPLVAQAIEKHGWDRAFESIWMLKNLPQTDETLLWLVQQVEPRRLPQDSLTWISGIIASADAEALAPHMTRLEGCRWLDAHSRKAVREKVQLLSVSGDACWQELQNLCERHKDDEDSGPFPFGRANRLVEAISREGQRHAERVLSVLSMAIEDFRSNPLDWLQVFVAMLAGVMRLEMAAPLLVAKLKHDDGDFMNEECTYALTKIGAAAVDAIATGFHAAPAHFRLYASSALQDMRGEKVVTTAMQLLKDEKDWDTREKFIRTVLANFETEGLRLAREFGIDDLPQARRELIAIATLGEVEFADLERLRQEDQEHRAEVRRRQEFFFGGNQPSAKPVVQPQTPVVQPILSGRKVGRNDPCPCGSGKKYKKCCMGKEQA